jgi:hypothetical protein
MVTAPAPAPGRTGAPGGAVRPSSTAVGRRTPWLAAGPEVGQLACGQIRDLPDAYAQGLKPRPRSRPQRAVLARCGSYWQGDRGPGSRRRSRPGPCGRPESRSTRGRMASTSPARPARWWRCRGCRRRAGTCPGRRRVDGAVDALARVRRDDRDVRRAEQPVVLEGLLGRRGQVSALHAYRLVQLPAGRAPPPPVHAVVLIRVAEVRVDVLSALSHMRAERQAEPLGAAACGDDDLPRLGVAPRRRTLRQREQPLDDRPRNLAVLERAAAPALAQQLLQHQRPVAGRTRGLSELDVVTVSLHAVSSQPGQSRIVSSLSQYLY